MDNKLPVGYPAPPILNVPQNNNTPIYPQPNYTQKAQAILENQPYSSTYSTPLPPVQTIKQEKEPFTKTKGDAKLFLFSFVLGYFFNKLILFPGNVGWGVTFFTFLYSMSVLFYARSQNIKASKESWFWLAILILTGSSYAIAVPFNMMYVWRFILLFCSCFYWSISLFGCLVQEKTSNYLVFDMINITFLIPFKNFFIGIKAIKPVKKEEVDNEKKQKYIAVLIGLAVIIPIFVILFPLLLRADSGLFRHYITTFDTYIYNLLRGEFIVYAILSVPIAFYISGKLIGSAHRRYTTTYKVESIKKIGYSVKILPTISSQIILGMVSMLYIFFILCQIPYFFSAFMGKVANGYMSYSEFARDGFFELCMIVFINLSILTIVQFIRVSDINKRTKWMNIILCLLTLLLILTALQKMILYISAYGLTTKRVLTSVFMIYLGIVFISIIVLQFKKFSIVRFSIIIGSVLFSFLSFVGIDDITTAYNFNAYIKGNIKTFDVCTMESSGMIGMDVVINGYQDIDKIQTRIRVKNELIKIEENAVYNEGESSDTITYFLLRNNEELKEIIN